MRDDFEDAADGIARAKDLIDFLHHARFGFRVDAAQRRIEIGAHRLDFFPGRTPLQSRVTDGDDVAQISRSRIREAEVWPSRPAAVRAAVSRAEARSRM